MKINGCLLLDDLCGYGEIGKRKALKMPRSLILPVRVRLPVSVAPCGLAGSSPAFGIFYLSPAVRFL